MAAASVAVVVVVGVVAFFGVGAEVAAVGGDAIVVVVTIFLPRYGIFDIRLVLLSSL